MGTSVVIAAPQEVRRAELSTAITTIPPKFRGTNDANVATVISTYHRPAPVLPLLPVVFSTDTAIPGITPVAVGVGVDNLHRRVFSQHRAVLETRGHPISEVFPQLAEREPANLTPACTKRDEGIW